MRDRMGFIPLFFRFNIFVASSVRSLPSSPAAETLLPRSPHGVCSFVRVGNTVLRKEGGSVSHPHLLHCVPSSRAMSYYPPPPLSHGQYQQQQPPFGGNGYPAPGPLQPVGSSGGFGYPHELVPAYSGGYSGPPQPNLPQNGQGYYPPSSYPQHTPPPPGPLPPPGGFHQQHYAAAMAMPSPVPIGPPLPLHPQPPSVAGHHHHLHHQHSSQYSDHPLGVQGSSTAPFPVRSEGSNSAASAAGGERRPHHGKTSSQHHHTPSLTEDFDSNAYLALQGFSTIAISEAKIEHTHHKIPFCASEETITYAAGSGYISLFTYHRWVSALTFLIFILQLVNYILFVRAETPQYRDVPQQNATWYDDFFISQYRRPNVASWQGTNIAGLVIALLFAPFYYGVVARRFAAMEQERVQMGLDAENIDPELVRYKADGLIDTSHRYRSRAGVLGRRCLSLLVFLAFVGLQVLASNLLTTVQQKQLGYAFSLGIALIAIVLNEIFARIADILTEFEKHETLGWMQVFKAMKRFAFMFCNIITVYAAKNYDQIAKQACVYQAIAEQFMLLLVLEIALVVPVSVLVTMFFNVSFQWWAKRLGTITSDNDDLPPFDLTVVYLRIMYKLYIGLMAAAVFPMSSALSVVAIFVDYWVFKFFLFKLCGRPKKMHASLRLFASLCTVFSVILAAVTPFAGVLWILAGWTVQSSKASGCFT